MLLAGIELDPQLDVLPIEQPARPLPHKDECVENMFLIVNTPKNYKNTFDQVDLLIIIDQFETRQVAVRGFLCWGSRQLKILGTSWVMRSAETKLLESNLESKSDFVQFGKSSFVSSRLVSAKVLPPV